MMVEPLESRRLLTGTPGSSQILSFELFNVLVVIGSGKANEISVVENNGKASVTNIQTGSTRTYSSVCAILIYGAGGDDAIFYTGNSIGACVRGGNGNDFITVADTGCGSSKVDGGCGDDAITILIGNKTCIDGGDGNDAIYLNTGVGVYNLTNASTIVDAGRGNDVVTTYAGKNSIYGGSGSDTVLNFGGTNIISSVESTLSLIL